MQCGSVRSGILLAAAVLLASAAQQVAAASPAAQQPPAALPAGQQAPAATPAPSQSQPPIRVTTGLVHLVVTVTDKQHDFVTDLDEKSFKILENGVPQDITFFGRETDLPLRIALLLDTSNSIRPRLEFEKDAAADFLNKVIRRGKDMAFLVTFDNEPQVIQEYTDEVDLLNTAIRRQRAGGATALNDAVEMASEKLAHAPPPQGEESDVRRVIVVISDGHDTLSDHALSDAINGSIRSEAVVYTISTNTDWLATDNPGKPTKYALDNGDKVLQQMADQTGGHAFFPYRIDDLAQSFLDIGTELRSQYFIGYTPKIPVTSGEYRKVDVQTDRKGLLVRSRRGYYAAGSASDTTSHN
jgi:Ca-activated chloride channel family protein